MTKYRVGDKVRLMDLDLYDNPDYTATDGMRLHSGETVTVDEAYKNDIGDSIYHFKENNYLWYEAMIECQVFDTFDEAAENFREAGKRFCQDVANSLRVIKSPSKKSRMTQYEKVLNGMRDKLQELHKIGHDLVTTPYISGNYDSEIKLSFALTKLLVQIELAEEELAEVYQEHHANN